MHRITPGIACLRRKGSEICQRYYKSRRSFSEHLGMSQHITITWLSTARNILTNAQNYSWDCMSSKESLGDSSEVLLISEKLFRASRNVSVHHNHLVVHCLKYTDQCTKLLLGLHVFEGNARRFSRGITNPGEAFQSIRECPRAPQSLGCPLLKIY